MARNVKLPHVMVAPRIVDLPPPRAALPGRGSLRVQAWIYTALNPILEACRREHELLVVGDASWRHAGADLAHVHRVEDRLSWSGRQNLADLLVFAPDLARLIDEHDQARLALLRAASLAQQRLLANRRFRGAIHATRHVVRGVSEDELAAGVAERLVNAGAGDPLGPAHAIWSAAHSALLPFAEEAAAAVGPPVKAIERAAVELGKAAVELRRRLCDDFDLPPAPIS
jgi:hypothetical protein